MNEKSTVHGPQSTVYGLILTGGKSSRMGYDKSLIDYHGKPQREYLFDVLSVLCEKVFVSCKSSEQIPANLNPLPDQFEMESPLNGILTALTCHPLVTWLVVAGDMPMINEDVLKHLLRNRNPEKVATCFWDSEHANPEPLLSIWEPQSRVAIEAFYSKGKISPRDFLKGAEIELLEPVADKMHLNINTPEELRAFQKGISYHKE